MIILWIGKNMYVHSYILNDYCLTCLDSDNIANRFKWYISDTLFYNASKSKFLKLLDWSHRPVT